MKSSILACVLALVATVAFAAPAAAGRQDHDPSPGAPGLGDRLFPTLGNGGYDARHYHLDLTYPTAEPHQTVDGEVTMLARATQSLSRFNLDFADGTVSDVDVNGRDAQYELSPDGELVITPRRYIRDRSHFVVKVDFTAGPDVPVDEFPFGWFTTEDGSVTAGQPDQGHTIYPVNDHPADKATYTFRLDVPAGVTAVASGEQLWERTRGGRSVSYHKMDEPMASELTQIAVGDLRVIDRGRNRHVELRDVAAESCADQAEPLMAETPTHMDWMVERAGRYPFDTYGVLAADQFFLYALETQTLSLHPCLLFDPELIPPETAETIMVHELAHQWYGDSVSPESWSDLWLNEGHATWYEQTFAAEFFGSDFEEFIRESYASSDEWREQYGPVAAPISNELFELFSPNVYEGGAVVLYALRQTIGERAFRELEYRWAQQYEGESVGTDEFIELAERISRRDLSDFAQEWLFSTTVPPMPGHPDWELDPAGADAPAPNRAMQLERGLHKH
jgi:aminopeptidase N